MNISYVRYLAWDSSPQFGRDYVMAIILSIKRSSLAKMLRCPKELFKLWERTSLEGADFAVFQDNVRRTKEKENMDYLRSQLDLRSFPVVTVGFGASSFEHKFATLIHAMRLEEFTGESLAYFIRQIVTKGADYGTERLLRRVMPALLANLTYFDDTPAETIKQVMEDVL